MIGVGVAMFNEISVKNGRVEQGNASDSDLARVRSSPADTLVHVMLSEFSHPLGGVGEPAVPPIAPAICNAILSATRNRNRQLPVRDRLRTQRATGRASSSTRRWEGVPAPA